MTPKKPHVKAHRDSLRQQAVEMYKAGCSGGDIAARLHIDKRTVYKYLHEARVMRPRGKTASMKGPLRDVSHSEVDRTVTLYLEGYSTYEVAEKLGLTSPTVRYRLKHAGVTLRTRSESVKLRLARDPRNNQLRNELGRYTSLRSASES